MAKQDYVHYSEIGFHKVDMVKTAMWKDAQSICELEGAELTVEDIEGEGDVSWSWFPQMWERPVCG